MKILMVCLGNICRSPLAEGIMQHLVETRDIRASIDSAGTSGWHKGEAPDPRSIEIAQAYGLDISQQRSRQVMPEDLDDFDLILAMDSQNLRDLLKMCSNEEQQGKIRLLLEYGGQDEINVPDPYWQGGFDHVYNLILRACEEICTRLEPQGEITTR